MFTILVVLIIFLCIILTLVVLAQAAKGNGLAGGLAAPGSVGTMFGVRRASDFVMRKSFLLSISAVIFLTASAGYGRRLKVYSFPKQIAAGQLATIIFENPNPDQQISRNKCTAEKLIAWVKSDVPILRIEQKNK